MYVHFFSTLALFGFNTFLNFNRLRMCFVRCVRKIHFSHCFLDRGTSAPRFELQNRIASLVINGKLLRATK